MSKPKSTGDIARELLRQAGEPFDKTTQRPKPDPVKALIASANGLLQTMREPWYLEEASALVGDEEDHTNKTRLAAAAEIVARDPRAMVETKFGSVRREFDDEGSTTRRHARDMVDLHAALGGYEISEQDQQAGALHDFSREVNDSTMEPTLPTGGSTPGSDQWSEQAAEIADSITTVGRDLT